MTTIAFVQARMNSSRLPGKVLKELSSGLTPLSLMLTRLRCSRLIDKIVVIAPECQTSKEIIAACKLYNVEIFLGSETNLLQRHLMAARHYLADICLKIPSDCPLIDSKVVDNVIQLCLDTNSDYASNLHPATFPDGLDVEVFKRESLEKAFIHSNQLHEFEHTTPYIWDTNPHEFSIANFTCPRGDFSMTHRWTIDYNEDFLFLQQLWEYIGTESLISYGYEDILLVLDEYPPLMAINKHLNGVNWYRNHTKDLHTIHSLNFKSF